MDDRLVADERHAIEGGQRSRSADDTEQIRYVVNTHAHYDHAGGLREYVAEGITVITHESDTHPADGVQP
jgi:glyoxylase-like metal-dependent hydrolase (beta-lactamase superfamily II)